MKNIKQAFIAPLTLTYAINQTLIEKMVFFKGKKFRYIKSF